MAVEGHELSDELAAVLDGDPHPVVDVLKHLRALRHRHCGLKRLLNLKTRVGEEEEG